MAQTEAQRRAKRKYDDKTYDLIHIKPRKAETEKIKSYAAERGESVTRFFVRSAFEQMERDKLSDGGGAAE